MSRNYRTPGYLRRLLHARAQTAINVLPHTIIGNAIDSIRPVVRKMSSNRG